MTQPTTTPVTASTTPALTPADHPDAAILAAFEKVRAHRAWVYSFDDVKADEATDQAISAADSEMVPLEALVHTTTATTVAGVLARLLLAIPDIDQERWVDRTLMQQGLLALYARRADLPGQTQQVTLAAHDLLRVQWRDGLAAYERSSGDYNAILNVKAVAEHEEFAQRRTGKPNAFAEAIHEKISVYVDSVMAEDSANIDRLIQTPVPDWTAYRRKAEIAIKECVADKAGPWLLQDANALLAAQDGEA